MDRELLAKAVLAGRSSRQIAQDFRTSQTNVRYWLKKFGLTTLTRNRSGSPRCKCGETDPQQYYKYKKQACKKCHNRYTAERALGLRRRAIELLGGCCKHCGFDKLPALDIHHIDPKLKDPNFKTHRGWSWERILQEIKGCIILCRNCHALHHFGYLVPDSRS